MIKKYFDNQHISNKTKTLNFLFYLSFLASIIVSITFEKKQLLYTMPLLILILLFKYLSIKKKNANPLYVIALLAVFTSTILSLLSFKEYFIWITSLTSLYLILCSLTLRKYLDKGKFKSLLHGSVIIAVIFVLYLIFAVVELVINYVPNNTQFYIFLTAFCLFIFSLTFAIIYINDNYANGTILLASGIFSIFQIALSPINEFFLYTKTFTVLIIFCHIISIFLFIKFVTETNPVEKNSNNYF
ncbi:hypothetical protein KO494_03165 [Lacinutrix sp. C3R15]|uniref:hypothetical protein n=1 Tax=Flavobacteriaceae TaxID=49546 RepID=UPI001C087DF1|nr:MULTISPECIES: hypothetical protein [Flavobacteriaceae]MBU2938531.1 hypothetical protein [Lacinutrix sp. C3R15]MDO6621845.1 hypothetical protein [Oceanihabitans sp. 1_MG-2023]